MCMAAVKEEYMYIYEYVVSSAVPLILNIYYVSNGNMASGNENACLLWRSKSCAHTQWYD